MDLIDDDTWEHSGEKLTYTSGWTDGQPDFGSHENCARLKFLGWGDIECDYNISFVCEVEN